MTFGTMEEKRRAERIARHLLQSAFGTVFGFPLLIGIFFSSTGTEAWLFFRLFLGLAALFLGLGTVGCVWSARSRGQSPAQCVSGIALTFVVCLVIGASGLDFSGITLYGAPVIALAVGLCIVLPLPDLWAEALKDRPPSEPSNQPR